MGILRSVGGRGDVDLDQRAITTEDDIVDLSELDRSNQQPIQPPQATQKAAAEHDEPGEGQPPAPASQPLRTPAETPPASDAPGRESDEDFDRWLADRAPALGSALAASKPNTPPLASDARDPASGDAATAASGTAGVPCDEPTVPAVTSPRSRLRRSGPLSRPLGRLARPAAAIAALALTAGGTAIAINAATIRAPRARPAISASTTSQTAGPSNRAGNALSRTIAAATSEFYALARAVPPAHRISHPPRKPRRHHASRHLRVEHPTTVTEQSTAAQTSPVTTPAPQTSPPTSAASSTSQTTAGSQTQATSTSQPAFGANGTLGPGRGAPGTQ